MPQSPPLNKNNPLFSTTTYPPKGPKLSPYPYYYYPTKPKPPSFKLNTSPPPKKHSSFLTFIPAWADNIKERRMQTPRELYTQAKWVQHRSSLRHIRHLLSSLSSRVILSLVPPVFAFTWVAFVVATYNTAIEFHLLPEFFPMLRASSLPYQLTAPALALLLVFRTEASYSRFEQGRKAWMKVLAGADDLARCVIGGVEGECDEGIKSAVLKYIMAFPVVLKCHVSYGSDISRDLQDLLEADDLTVVLSSQHQPRCIIEFISQSLRLLKLEESKRNMMESKISCFHEGISVCDQLEGIPIPLSYTRLTSRFLVLWHLTLPIILWDDCHWLVVPSTFVSAASLFCIEEVGVLIEEPFPMLALDELCKQMQKKIREAISMEKVVKAQVAGKMRSQPLEHSQNGWPHS